MRIYALVGPSGTGKSHRAMLVAHQEDIEVIIDDGLLIKNGRKLAGRSAKGSDNLRGGEKGYFFRGSTC